MGTIHWMAPEIFGKEKEPYTSKSDMYALSVN